MGYPAVCKSFLFLLLFWAETSSAIAQKKDSIRVNTHFTTLVLIEEKTDTLIAVDTLLDGFQQYNPIINFDYFGSNSGVLGSPSHSWYFLPEHESGFSSGLNAFNPYKKEFKTIRFFDTHTPYTDLIYIQGDKELQSLNALHTRNINPFWNITVNYHTGLSSEFYGNLPANLQNKIKNLSITTHLKSKDDRYNLYMAVIKNKFVTSDNGGINDTSYADYSWNRKFIAKVFLSYAKLDLIDKQFAFQQSFKLEKKQSDSLRQTQQKEAGFYLIHKFDYHLTTMFYTDKYLGEDYYKAMYNDSSITNDSMGFKILENEFWLKQVFGEEKGEIQAGIRHSMTSAYQNNLRRSFTDLTALFQMRMEVLKGELKLDGDYVLDGLYKDDYSISVKYSHYLTPNWKLLAGGLFKESLTDYIFWQATSNHLQWYNFFEPLTTTSVYTAISNHPHHFQTLFRFNHMTNYVYFDDQIKPVQYGDKLSHLSLLVTKNLSWGVFHFNNNILIQYSSNNSILAVPSWMINNLTYVEGNLFKNAMHVQAGLSLRMAESFYADALYAPFALFYRQSSTLVKSYPLVDVFINARIKRVRIFVKFEHVNYGFPSADYFIIPNYPYKQRAFVFGVSWLFFD